MRKILLITIAIVALIFQAKAQQVIASSGGYFEGENVSLNWTVGEPVIETFTGGNLILTQGFQQPYNFYLQQILNIPVGWSGISTFISPEDDNVEQMFDPIINDLIILQNASGMFYPEENINTLDNWNVNEGYMIKVADTVELFISGTRESNLSLQLVAGWNLIPVLSECDVDIAELFNGTDLIIIKEVAGWGIFWPEFGINTLGALKSGKAYFVFMENEGEITFPECE